MVAHRRFPPPNVCGSQGTKPVKPLKRKKPFQCKNLRVAILCLELQQLLSEYPVELHTYILDRLESKIISKITGEG